MQKQFYKTVSKSQGYIEQNIDTKIMRLEIWIYCSKLSVANINSPYIIIENLNYRLFQCIMFETFSIVVGTITFSIYTITILTIASYYGKVIFTPRTKTLQHNSIHFNNNLYRFFKVLKQC
jgi:hypothetical protein